MKSFLSFCSEVLSWHGIYDAMVICHADEWCLVRYKGYYVLAIRGTRGWREWLNNFWPGGWESAADRIIADYSLLYPYWRPEYVIGYSRGGAIALIIADKWKARCVTFSAPRIGGLDFELALSEPPLMISTKWDIVSEIPPWNKHPDFRVSIQLPGWRHKKFKIQDIPDAQVNKLEKLLKWPLN